MGALPEDTDAVLMLRVQQGDAAAFEEIVARYKQPVMNLVCRTLRDRDEAEDLAQTVFVQVFKSAARYRAEARFATWLFTIARNLCLNEIRRRSRHPAEPLEGTRDVEEGMERQIEDRRVFSPPDALLQRELQEKIELALAELPETQRTALLLVREKEMSYEDIAKVMHCSLAATKSLIHRARESLKAKLKPYLRTGAAWETNEQKL